MEVGEKSPLINGINATPGVKKTGEVILKTSKPEISSTWSSLAHRTLCCSHLFLRELQYIIKYIKDPSRLDIKFQTLLVSETKRN